jgi:hypothetical protein
MKKTTLRVQILALLLLWFGFVGTSSAYSTSDPNYVGDLTLDTISYPGFQYFATNEHPAGDIFFSSVVHLYSFTLIEGMSLLDVYAEFRSGSPLMITIFDSSDVELWNNGSGFLYDYSYDGNYRDSAEILNIPVNWAAGLYWLVVQADPTSDAGVFSETGAYDVYLKGAPNAVPLPPALLLFGSSLIGFITLGWRRSKA